MRDNCYIGATIIETINTPTINSKRDILAAWEKYSKMPLIKLSIHRVEFPFHAFISITVTPYF